MAGLDDLYAQIPTSEIATKLGADEGEVVSAVHTLVPVLLSGLHQNAQDPQGADRIESAATSHAASGLLDSGGGVDQVGETDGHLGGILGNVLGGKGGALGDILGGLLGGKK